MSILLLLIFFIQQHCHYLPPILQEDSTQMPLFDLTAYMEDTTKLLTDGCLRRTQLLPGEATDKRLIREAIAMEEELDGGTVVMTSTHTGGLALLYSATDSAGTEQSVLRKPGRVQGIGRICTDVYVRTKHHQTKA